MTGEDEGFSSLNKLDYVYAYTNCQAFNTLTYQPALYPVVGILISCIGIPCFGTLYVPTTSVMLPPFIMVGFTVLLYS